MSLAGHRPKSGSRHVGLIILYKGNKGVNDAARPPKGGPVEAGSLSATSLPWGIDRTTQMQDSPLNSQRKYPLGFPNVASRTPSNQLNLTKQVKPAETSP